MEKLLIAVTVLVLIAWVVNTQRGKVRPEEARALVESGALLLDVRTPSEFQAGHIAGAVNVPVDALREQTAKLGATDRPVVLYCRSGSRSATASRILRNAGFRSVHDLGAMSRW